MAKPQLYVFAGPNGAGKSTLSAEMTGPGTPVYDGDIRFSKLKTTFYDLDESKIWLYLNETDFPDWKSDAISTGKDAAFETNFRDPEVIASVQQFMAAGYESRLLFMGLDSIEQSIDRVKLRVAKGGHNVSLENIINNYNRSLDNLEKYYRVFTSVHLYQNFQSPGLPVEMTPLMTIIEGGITELSDNLPEWAGSVRDLIVRSD